MGPGAELSTYALSVLSQGCRMELRMGQKEQWATDQGLLPELFRGRPEMENELCRHKLPIFKPWTYI